MSDISVDGKESLYVIDGFMAIDWIDKSIKNNQIKGSQDILVIEQFIRNHMRPGHYDEPVVEKERDTLYFHDQVSASDIDLNKEVKM